MKESNLSPEQFGKELGISGMTLRRWRHMPPEEALPDIYKESLIRALHKLVAEGKLSMQSKNVKDLLLQEWLPFETVAKGLGISKQVLDSLKETTEGSVETLSQIGGDQKKRDLVDASTTKISSFKKMGEDWTFRITKLLSVIHSRKLHLVEKMVAYGALFYLLNPFDFLPDHIPVFGFLDDLFFLSAALSFYLARYPTFFKDKNEE